jgi:hypothetical protein
MWNNMAGKSGTAYLADCLNTNSTLKTLYVNDNNAGRDAVGNFKAALENNESLTDLDLLDNSVDIVKLEDQYHGGFHISDLEFTLLKDMGKTRPDDTREVVNTVTLGRRKVNRARRMLRAARHIRISPIH